MWDYIKESMTKEKIKERQHVEWVKYLFSFSVLQITITVSVYVLEISAHSQAHPLHARKFIFCGAFSACFTVPGTW